MWDFEGVFEAEQEVGVCRIVELYGGRLWAMGRHDGMMSDATG